MFKIKKGSLLLLSLLIILSLVISNQVLADNLTEDYMDGFKTKEDLLDYLEDNQVPKEKQDILITKVENNEIWDCYKDENLDLIPNDFHTFNPYKGNQTRYFRFEDGSFVKVETQLQDKIKIDGSKKSETLLKQKIKDKDILKDILSENSKLNRSDKKIDNQIMPLGSSSGSGYSWYWDWKIYKSIGAQRAWFYAEFCNVNGGADYIVPSGCYGGEVRGFGTISNKKITIPRQKEDTSRSRLALARLSWTANYNISTPWGGGGIGGGTYSLYLGVGHNTYYVSDKVPYQ